MLLSSSTLHTHHKFDLDLYSHRVPFVISWPIYIYILGQDDVSCARILAPPCCPYEFSSLNELYGGNL